MTFRVVSKPSNSHVRCPYRVIERTTGREIEWINQYLDYETLRRLAHATLRTYADALLHFLRWWESVHHTDEVTKDALTESTLLDYVRFQSSQEHELTGATINQRVAIVDRALRIAFPGAPGQIAPALQSTYWQRAPMGIGKPRPALSRLRVKTAKRTIVPLSVDEVARFWSSFRNSRDLAIVGVMLLQGFARKRSWICGGTICCCRNRRSGYAVKATRPDSCRWPRRQRNSLTTICGLNGRRLRRTLCLFPSKVPLAAPA